MNRPERRVLLNSNQQVFADESQTEYVSRFGANDRCGSDKSWAFQGRRVAAACSPETKNHRFVVRDVTVNSSGFLGTRLTK